MVYGVSLSTLTAHHKTITYPACQGLAKKKGRIAGRVEYKGRVEEKDKKYSQIEK